MTANPGRVLVTGARGFLGRAVVAELRRRFPNAYVAAVSRRPPGADDLQGPALDLSLPQSWAEIAGPFDWIFHLAAHIPSPRNDRLARAIFDDNVSLCLSLLHNLARWRPSRLIYASSISVYPMGAADILREDIVPFPNTLYSAAKLAGEHILSLANDIGARVITLRLSSLYGRGQHPESVLPHFISKAANGEPIMVFAGGTRTQDFLYITDAAQGLIDAAASSAAGVYNLGSGAATSMMELARIIAALPGWEADIIDGGGKEAGPSAAVDISKAKRDWSYAPRITIKNGLKIYHDSLLGGAP